MNDLLQEEAKSIFDISHLDSVLVNIVDIVLVLFSLDMLWTTE